jgi:T5SS/PEP-CTERM-associated repeat protein
MMKRRNLMAVAGAVAFCLSAPPRLQAQYTADFQTNIISAVTSNWGGYYDFGYTNSSDALLIQSSGMFVCGGGYVGFYITKSSSNSVLVSGPSSVWDRGSGFLGIGDYGSYNSLMISNGGGVICFNGATGLGEEPPFSSNDIVVVTGAGSFWRMGGALNLGDSGPHNILIINDGGQVFDAWGYVASVVLQ